MMVEWMRVGFVHGVMNTDNMSILGLTIDYGPYGWLEDYDPDWTPNTTDAGGRRYRFGYQPQIALWNLAQLANAIHPLIGAIEPLETALRVYSEEYQRGWQAMTARKLGLQSFEPASDLPLVVELDKILRLVETDMTIFYRRLADLQPGPEQDDDGLLLPLMEAYYQPEDLSQPIKRQIGSWLRSYLQRVARDGLDLEERRQRMNAVNPRYVLRNYLAQLAIDRAEEGDFSPVGEQLEVLRHPYDDQPGKEKFAEKRPEWARHRPGCSMLSCSS